MSNIIDMIDAKRGIKKSSFKKKNELDLSEEEEDLLHIAFGEWFEEDNVANDIPDCDEIVEFLDSVPLHHYECEPVKSAWGDEDKRDVKYCLCVEAIRYRCCEEEEIKDIVFGCRFIISKDECDRIGITIDGSHNWMSEEELWKMGL